MKSLEYLNRDIKHGCGDFIIRDHESVAHPNIEVCVYRASQQETQIDYTKKKFAVVRSSNTKSISQQISAWELTAFQKNCTLIRATWMPLIWHETESETYVKSSIEAWKSRRKRGQ